MIVSMVSLGCAKNLVDAERMLYLLKEAGHTLTVEPGDAEIAVVNTCGFIQSAKEEAIETILELVQLKAEGTLKAIIVTGCLAERYREEMAEQFPEVDAVIGLGDEKQLCAVIDRVTKGDRVVQFAPKKDLPLTGGRVLSTLPFFAYLKIAEGCDNRCTYCAIPYIRGKYRSRSIENIVAEAQALCEDGVKELIVVAQDTTRYGIDLYGEKKIAELLTELCKIEKLQWVRIHYCYPEELDDKLIETIKNENKIVKYLDIPVQHGCDSVLKRMGRKTDRKSIEELVLKLRREIPEITLRTSIIAGFPGETEQEFNELCEFLETVKFDRTGVFAFSCEEGTPAARLKGQLEEEVKEERRNIVMELCQRISLKRNEAMVGKVITVMAEGFEDNLYYGRSGAESIEIDPKIYFGAHRDLNPGDFVQVEIKSADVYDLYGEERTEE